MQTVISWYIALQMFAFVVFPLLFGVCNRLPDRAWALAKGLGLVFVTYLVWLMGNYSEPGSRWNFSFSAVGAAVLFLGVFGLFKAFRSAGELAEFFSKKWKVILVIEALFLATFAMGVSLRATIPHISYHNMDPQYNSFPDHAAEKFTDFAILNSLLTSSTFPPHDAWLSGETLNYYYFGHLMWATVIKFTSVRPEIGYNLALAGILGLISVLAFSLGYNVTGRKRYGFLALFLIVFSGNLDGFLQLLGIIKTSLLDITATDRLWNFASPWWRNYDFWRSSRAVENTINEFPAFSVILGDLHAHLNALPIFLCGLILAIQIMRNIPHYASLWRYEVRNIDELFIAAIIVGALSASNSWDVIGYGGFLALAIWSGNIVRTVPFGYYRPGEKALGRFMAAIESLMVALIVVVVGVLFLFHPFLRHFHTPLNNSHFPSPATLYLKSFDFEALFGKFGIGIVTPTFRSNIIEVASHWVLLAWMPITFAVIFLRRKFAKPEIRGVINREAIVAIGLILLSCAFIMRSAWQSWTAVLSPLLALVSVFAILFIRMAPTVRLLFGILFQFFLFLWFCEIFYFDDIFDGAIQRINTVFKAYYGLWVLMALASVIACERLVCYIPEQRRMRAGSIMAIAIVLVGGVYPILGTVNRISGSTRLGHWDAPKGMSPEDAPYTFLKPEARAKNLDEALDGMRYLRYLHPDDYAAMIWLRTETEPDTKILEAAGSSYTYSGRFGTMTGRPTYAGWLSHSWGWRGNRFGDPENPNNARARRLGVTETIYNTSDAHLAKTLIEETGAQYIIVGDWERQQYPHLNIKGIESLASPVYTKGGTTIYKVNE